MNSNHKTSNDIERIYEALSCIPANDRDVWLKMGMAIKSELGEAGFEVWNNWSEQHKTYNTRDALAVWKSIHSDGGITIGTLFHEAKINGWKENGIYHKPTLEEIVERKRIADERAEQEQIKINQEKVKAEAMAKKIWEKGREAKADTPYLARKNTLPVSTMKEIDADEVASILGYVPSSRGEPLTGCLLVNPIKVGDRFSSIELIDGAGRKAALAGRGTKSGGYWASQRLPDEDAQGLTLVIGEGVITVLAVQEPTGYPAVAALSSSNLVSVSKAMRERYPTASLIILADLVKETGEPDPHAITAAQTVNGILAVPYFGLNRIANDKDFNDMKLAFGIEAIRQVILNAKKCELAIPNLEITTVERVDNKFLGEKDEDISTAPKFPVISAADFASLGNSSWLIKNIIPQAELVMLFGQSGCGKSFFVLDIAFAIARGIDWIGHKVHQGRVVYIAAEGAGGVPKRLLAYAKYHDIKLDGLPLDFITVAPDFLGTTDAIEVINIIDQASLVILDTLACIAPGGEENSGADMGKVLARCKSVHKSTGAVILLVHHTGKDVTRGARGWSGLRAAVDAEIEVKSVDHGFQIRITKLKDGESGQTYDFNLIRVDLDTDEDGDSITSCIVKHVYDLSTTSAKLKPKGKWEKLIIQAMEQIAKEEGKALKESVLDYAVGLELKPDGKRDQRKGSASRALNTLVEQEFYTISGEFILNPKEKLSDSVIDHD